MPVAFVRQPNLSTGCDPIKTPRADAPAGNAGPAVTEAALGWMYSVWLIVLGTTLGWSVLCAYGLGYLAVPAALGRSTAMIGAALSSALGRPLGTPLLHRTEAASVSPRRVPGPRDRPGQNEAAPRGDGPFGGAKPALPLPEEGLHAVTSSSVAALKYSFVFHASQLGVARALLR